MNQANEHPSIDSELLLLRTALLISFDLLDPSNFNTDVTLESLLKVRTVSKFEQAFQMDEERRQNQR